MIDNTLCDTYAKACEQYLQTFCGNYGLQYERDAWVANDIGGIASVGDYFFDFLDVIKYSVDNNLTDWDELLRWYDYTLDAHELGLSIPNFRAWHKGCPRTSDEKINELKSMRKELLNAIEEAKDSF